MSEPEIARRCPGCEAMVRASATFCPLCGTPLKRRSPISTTTADTTTATAPASGETITPNNAAANDNEKPPEPFTGLRQEKRPDKSASGDSFGARTSPPPTQSSPPSASKSASPATGSFATGKPDNIKQGDNQRRAVRVEGESPRDRRRVITTKATAARAQIGDNLRPRVEKLRQTSATVIDEAADDPGLRFVLVAAFFFLLALLLLLFSRLLG